jgi:hypothetical protein
MSDQDTIQRTVLPIPDQPHVGLTTYDAKGSGGCRPRFPDDDARLSATV